MSGQLRFEPWTLPTAATFTKADISMPVLDAEGRRELSAFSDCRCLIPDSWSKVSTLATHPLVRVFDGDTVVDEFVVERRPRRLQNGAVLDASGPQLGQWGLSRTLVYPPDYGTNPSKRPNWKWGIENLIDLAITNLGNTSEVWSLYLSGERYELDTSLATAGTYTLTVGGNTTAAIDFDASPSTIESELEGLAGVTDVTVTQPDPDVNEYFVIFENPKDLGSNMTITDSTSGGGVMLTKLNDGFDTGTSPTFTITVDGQTTSALAWNASANTVEGSATAGTGLQGLSNVSDVSVSGSGTFDDPWIITFHNPPDIDSFTVTFAAGTAVTTRTVAGGFSADPVTISKPIDEGTGPEEVHGAYRNPPLEVNTDVVDTDADYSIQVNANGKFAGSQIVLNVEAGEIYQASIRLRPAAAGSYVLVIHDEFQNQIARTGDIALTAGTFQELSLSDILIPDGVKRVIMRVAVVSVVGSTANQYVNWQGAKFMTGLEETNPGDIVKTILEWSQVQGDGVWIDPSFDETNDSASNAWTQSYSYQADGFAMHLLHVLEDMRDLGYEFTLTPKATPSGSLTHDLNLYMPGGAGTDRTTTGPALMTGGAIVDGEVVDRIPDFTAAVAWGADDLYLEDTNATTAATYGRLTKVVDVEQHGNEVTLQDALDAAFSDEETNRQAGSVMLSGSGSVVPFVHFDIGDTLVWQAGDRMAKNNRRIQTITWKHGDPVASYEIQGSRVWSDPMAAIAEGLRRLMDAPKKRRRGAKTNGIDKQAGTGSVGAHIHLNRATSQSIPSGTATAVAWDSAGPIPLQRFATPSFPLSAVTIQEPGYYDVAVQLGWDTYGGGGSVSVVRVRGGVEQPLWPPSADPGLWSSTSARLFEGVAPAIPCLSGDQIKVHISQSSGSDQSLASASLALYLVDFAAASPKYYDVVMADGPVGYWRMDDSGSTALDSSGNGHNGVYVGSPTQAAGVMADGTGSPSVRFDGSTQYVTVDALGAGLVGATNLTVEAWVNLDTLPAVFACIFEIFDPAAVDTNLRGLFVKPSGRLTWFIDTVVSTESNGSLTAGQAHYMAITTAADGTLKFYIDGVLDKTASSAGGSTIASTWDATIGMDLDGATPGDFLDGFLDEVAVYDRVLSETEIREHYDAGVQ